MCFFFKPAASPEELVSAVLSWLGHPLKLALLPIIPLALSNVFWIKAPNALGTLLWDWRNNFNYTFIFMFGYVITSADEAGMRNILKRGQWLYLILGLLLGVFYSITWLILPEELHPIFTFVAIIWSAAAEWNLVIGVYVLMRQLVTRQIPHISLLSQVAMPFYLTHQQILVALLSLSLLTPVLNSFPIMLILATIITTIISLLITKLNPLRYWFGLTPAKGSLLPGTTLGGFLPLSFLTIAVVLVYTIQFYA